MPLTPSGGTRVAKVLNSLFVPPVPGDQVPDGQTKIGEGVGDRPGVDQPDAAAHGTGGGRLGAGSGVGGVVGVGFLGGIRSGCVAAPGMSASYSDRARHFCKTERVQAGFSTDRHARIDAPRRGIRFACGLTGGKLATVLAGGSTLFGIRDIQPDVHVVHHFHVELGHFSHEQVAPGLVVFLVVGPPVAVGVVQGGRSVKHPKLVAVKERCAGRQVVVGATRVSIRIHAGGRGHPAEPFLVVGKAVAVGVGRSADQCQSSIPRNQTGRRRRCRRCRGRWSHASVQ